MKRDTTHRRLKLIAVNCWVAITLFVASGTYAQNITTVAGDGVNGYNGDNISAITAELKGAVDIAVDGAGNIYIADNGNQRVRKVTIFTGIITTIAGTGTAGYNGDNIAATSAQLSTPYGVASDAVGNIYIADEQNHRIRKIDATTGLITTVAGNGTAGFSGDGFAATDAQLSGPVGVSLDAAGNIYIADWQNNRVRKVTVATGIITTVAGNGSQGYNGDNIAATSASIYYTSNVAVDAAGNIYVADYDNSRVRKVNASTGIITTVAGLGGFGYNGDNIAATAALLYGPTDVGLDAAGNIYISDQANSRVRKVDVSTGLISTVAGTSSPGYNGDNIPANTAQLNYATGVVLDAAGNIYIADNVNNRIRKIIVAALPALNCTVIRDSFCACASVPVSYSGSGTFNSGNIFTAQLSDVNGSFTSPVDIGSLQSTVPNGTIDCIIPCNSPDGVNYRIRVISSNQAIQGADNVNNLTINVSVNASLTISANPADTICTGTPVTFSANPGNGGGTPFFQWRLNGKNIGDNNLSYISDTLMNGDTVACTMISNAACVTGSSVVSNIIIAKVKPSVAAGVIHAVHDTICSGTLAYLTLTGNSGYVQWQSTENISGSFSDLPGATSQSYNQVLPQTTYYRTLANNNTCADTSIVFTENVVASPLASFTDTVKSSLVSFNADSSIGAEFYYWDFGDSLSDTQPNPIHTFDTVGTYHVCLTVRNNTNCTYTLCHNLSILSSGTGSLINEKEINIYPNPADDFISVRSNIGNTEGNVRIYNSIGQLISIHDLREERTIDVRALSPGIYCITIGKGNLTGVKKFLIEHTH